MTPRRVDAGNDRTVCAGCLVSLHATSQVSDPADLPLEFSWRQVSGPSVVLEDARTSEAVFLAPCPESVADLRFAIDLRLADGTVETDEVRIVVEPPLALDSRPSIQFQEHLVDSRFNYPFGFAVGDLDRDGDLDLTVPDVWADQAYATPAGSQVSALYWYENHDGLTFTRHLLYMGEPGFLERHAIGDVDVDDWLDVVIVNNRDGRVLWFRNPGAAPNAGLTGVWTRNVLTTELPRAYDVDVADFDADGDLDVAASGYSSNVVAIFENLGTPENEQSWPQYMIGEKLSEARTIRVGDFDRDGRPDLLASAAGAERVPIDEPNPSTHNSRVVWFRNPGRFPLGLWSSLSCPDCNGSWRRTVIDPVARAAGHGQPADMTGDAELDVIMAYGMRDNLIPAQYHQVAWHEAHRRSDGTQLWFEQGIAVLPYAFEATAADLDGDGDVDAAATAHQGGDRIVWYERLRERCPAWRTHQLRDHWTAANQVRIADLDGDGRLDIVATADNGNGGNRQDGGHELRWWRNLGAAP